MSDDDEVSTRREHKVSAGLPSDPFDRLLSRMMGLPNGAHTLPTVVQVIDFYGNITQIRRRHGKRIAEERKAAGVEPGFLKGRKARKAVKA